VKVDPIEPAKLKAGLEVMAPRLVAQVDAYKKIAPNPQNRYFMHPDQTKSASVEFNTQGLTSLTLSPYIGDFSHNTFCATSSKAGIVQLTCSVDGGRKNQLTVDRNYVTPIRVDVSKSSRVTLEVDKGNDVIWCDWFSVGFLDVM
jgi:hypothetical protein